MSQTPMIDGIDFADPAPGRLLPPRAYSSAEVYAAEMERIFARSWVHVADVPDLVRPGDFVAATIGDTPVVVMLGEDGEIRTFLNACRHRGALLAAAHSTAPTTPGPMRPTAACSACPTARSSPARPKRWG
jgi:3-phenylpropionate/trans-cinnamate dioxygenase alpha subunit